MILDIENPEQPRIDQVYNAGGCINDLHDVKLGITYVSEFAYLADGKNGLRVVQLTSPGDAGQRRLQPAADAAADRHLQDPARRPRAGDRRRASTATGPWTRAATRSRVFGRVGARPLNLEEQQKMYLRDGQVVEGERRPAATRSTANRDKRHRERGTSRRVHPAGINPAARPSLWFSVSLMQSAAADISFRIARKRYGS